jgi:REP element-mobilizing transposase RayT/CheY-like chemotaxis protein
MTTNNEGSLQISKVPLNKPSILVVTPLSDLGELISDSLKEYSNCEHFANASRTITYLKQHEDCKQAILDMEMGEMRVLDLGRALRKLNPTVEIVIISKEEPPSDLEAIQPWKFLRKPLLLNNLLTALGFGSDSDGLSSNRIDLTEDCEENASRHWTRNAALATRQLARLIEKSSAQEVLLIQNQTLWSYSGQLSKVSVQEVDRVISKVWDTKNQSDLMRYIKLESTQTEYALYATVVAVGVILALVFDSKIPFSIVRKQTSDLASTLLLPGGNENRIKALSSGESNRGGSASCKSTTWKRFETPKCDAEIDGMQIGSSSYTFNQFVNAHLNGKSLQENFEQPPLAGLFGDIETYQASEENLHTISGMEKKDYKHAAIHFETVSDGLYNLTYSCLLVPRFGSHHLTTDRVKLVTDCMKEIYTSYGWRLEQLDVKSDYLQWVASIPPTIALIDHISIIRKETSKRLFEDFPPYKQENLSNDYWAPGYLIMGGKNSITDALVRDYTRQTREKYGFLPN